MKKILKENITQEKIDQMQGMIDMSVKILIEIEEQSRKQVLITVGSSFRKYVVDTLDYYHNHIMNFFFYLFLSLDNIIEKLFTLLIWQLIM